MRVGRGSRATGDGRRATGHGRRDVRRWQRTLLVAALAAGTFVSALAAQTQHPVPAKSGPRAATRIVSIVPAVTEMLFAIGAGPRVAAVSSFDHFPAEVEALPRVGALLDPDMERILSLRPDLVVTYGSQADLQVALKRAGIRTYSYRHGGVEGALRTIRELGPLTGTEAGATAAAASLQARLDGIGRRVAGRPRPRTMLVFGRQPGTLRSLFVAGGVGFMHDLLTIAGATNVFADIKRESVQPSQELLLVRKPDVVLELNAGQTTVDVSEAVRAWAALGSVPAVREGRIHALAGAYLVVAGPRLGDAAEAIARAVHPDAF